MQRYSELSDTEKQERVQRLAQKALLAYGLSGDLTLVGGSTNTVFRLRTGGFSYAVRVSPAGCDHAPLRRELTWLAALGRDTLFPLPEPVLSLSGDLFRSVSMEGVPGTRACSVLRWVDGERREAELTRDEATAMGRLAATLHAHAEVFRWPEELASEYVDAASRSLAAADALRVALRSDNDRALLCDAVACVAAATSGLGDGADCVGIIHGDLRLRKLRHDGESVGAVGFDACRVGAYLDDLSVLWSELAGREASTALQAALLEGYCSLRSAPVLPSVLDAFVTLRKLEDAACSYRPGSAARGLDRAAAERAVAILRRGLAPGA